ncbi:MAG: serine/threonine protein kinase [Planctomycetaceae bacterium]|jgi:serine/threonine-protein kinase|nr:serine/threonine protein kinase [Planctomycetaceae bacterium]
MQPEKLGPFFIGRILGRGGMGAVYEGVHEQTGEVAAVKVLLDMFEHEQDIRLRFEAEIETLKRLRHPNIVRLFGFGKEHGLLYYVMELVNGASLYAELRRKRNFYWYEVAKIGMEMCFALRHAHDRGITHRDVKPANILLENEGAIKLSDFGIASFFGSQRLTDVNAVVGTLEYMSPEQALAAPVGPRSDMYSLGAVLYSLLLGKPPFTAKHLAEIIKKHQENIVEPIRLTRIDVPEELEAIILSLLQIQPETRPQSPFAVARRFQSIIQSQFGLPDQIIIRPSEPKTLQDPETTPQNLLNSLTPEKDNLSVNDGVVDLGEIQFRYKASPNNAVSIADSFGRPGGDDVDVTKSLTDVDKLRPNDPDVNSTQFIYEHPKNISPVAENENINKQQIDAARQYGEREPNKRNDNSPIENAGSDTTKRRTNLHGQPAVFTKVLEDELGNLPHIHHTPRLGISLQTVFASLSLLLIGGVVYFLLQPEPPEKRYNRIISKLKITRENGGDYSVESLRHAEADIRYFLDHHADHPRIGQVRIYEEQINLANLERRLERRRQLSDPTAISQVERAYLEATSWIKSDPNKAVKKLRAIIDLFDENENIDNTNNETKNTETESTNNKKISNNNTDNDNNADDNNPNSDSSKPESNQIKTNTNTVAVELNKIEQEQTDSLNDTAQQQALPRNPIRRLSSPTEMCVELSRRRLRELEKVIESITQDQKIFLTKRLTDAKELMQTDSTQAAHLLSGIIVLYGEQEWADEFVKESLKLLNEINKTKKNNTPQKTSTEKNE